jgi:type IV pilus assembly protein PilM
VAIIDLGASTTKMAVVDYGIMKETHSISHGSQEMTLALATSLNIDFSRAEEMKREIGLSDLPEHREVVSILEPVLEYIIAEAERFIKDFQKKSNRSVGKIILSGGGSLLKGIVDFSVKKFTIEVELADPFAKVEYPVFLSGAVKGAGVNFSIAAGLALRDL